jgi:class 3 adenylate cyclase
MTTQEVKRKLTAILSADVKGYSRLMGEDEEATVRTLNAYKGVMTGLIQQHRGRVEEARAQAEEVMRLNPKFSLDRWARTTRLKDPAEVERFFEGLRKAGLK